MKLHRTAPAEVVRGPDALPAGVARMVAHTAQEAYADPSLPELQAPVGPQPAPPFGRPSVLLVHGPHGYDTVRARLDAALAAAEVRVHRHRHEGPCHVAAIRAAAEAAAGAQADWVLGVGGGRVLDVAKGAARLIRAPYAALPTSPATCAATAPTVVVYEKSARHRHAWESGPSPSLAILDPAQLAAAPDRLLTSGIVDQFAKIHEVRLTSGDMADHSALARAAMALIEDLGALLGDHAQTAIDAGPDGARDRAALPVRRLVAEAVVSHPGLIGGLAGREAKLAVAHPVHDALTAYPGAFAALHGEKVGFGSLVQLLLTAGADAARAEAERYARLGFACHLRALGCADACSEEGIAALARDALTDPAVTAAIPGLSDAELAHAIAEADAIGRAVAPA